MKRKYWKGDQCSRLSEAKEKDSSLDRHPEVKRENAKRTPWKGPHDRVGLPPTNDKEGGFKPDEGVFELAQASVGNPTHINGTTTSYPGGGLASTLREKRSETSEKKETRGEPACVQHRPLGAT